MTDYTTILPDVDDFTNRHGLPSPQTQVYSNIAAFKDVCDDLLQKSCFKSMNLAKKVPSSITQTSSAIILTCLGFDDDYRMIMSFPLRSTQRSHYIAPDVKGQWPAIVHKTLRKGLTK